MSSQSRIMIPAPLDWGDDLQAGAAAASTAAPLAVLVIHNLDNLYSTRRSALDHFLCFERYAPRNAYLSHRITLPITDAIRNTDWDVIIFDPSALGICTFRPRELFLREKERWSFLRDVRALKVVVPQDDANQGGLMDDWFDEIEVDALFTVRPEHSGLLYPKTSARADVRGTLAGFVNDAGIEAMKVWAKPFHERSRELGQRVGFYPPHGGRHARIKGESAEIVKKAALERGMDVDISTRPEDVLHGDDWIRFLGDCKFVLGAEGGLGLWDPYGEIYDRIQAFLAEHPGASFDEVEAACFPGLDGKHIFPGFTPRILEAALCGCCQILIEGHYLGVLEPYKHYIPLRRDYSNLNEVFDLMKDEVGARHRADAAYEALIGNPNFHYSTFVERFFSYVRGKLQERGGSPQKKVEGFASLKEQHLRQLIDATAAREHGVGYVDVALVDKVSDLIERQFADPLVFPDAMTDSARRRCRDLAEHRTTLFWRRTMVDSRLERIEDQLTQLRAQLQEAGALPGASGPTALFRCHLWLSRLYSQARDAIRRHPAG